MGRLRLRDNISINNIDETETDHELIELFKYVGIDINSKEFIDGLETYLGREFDGIELSGGQWQRLAIARGLFKKNKLLILDEPTSAIDPLEETKLYNQFKDICKDKTAIHID